MKTNAMLTILLALACPESRAGFGERWYVVGQHYHSTADIDYSRDPHSHGVRDSYDPSGVREVFERGWQTGLDALVLTDHNTVASCFDRAFGATAKPAAICGEEWTAKKSIHLGLINPPVDGPKAGYLPRSPGVEKPKAEIEAEARELIAALRAKAANGGRRTIVVINHPGWEQYMPSDSLGADAAEVVVPRYENALETRLWWLRRLAAGDRLVALAGSDFHACADEIECLVRGDVFRSYFDEPLNLIPAPGSSTHELLEAMARGRVVAVSSPAHKRARIEMTTVFDAHPYRMGDAIPEVPKGAALVFRFRLRNMAGRHAAVFSTGNPAKVVATRRLSSNHEIFEIPFNKRSGHDAIHVEVFADEEDDWIEPNDPPMALGNPIYF